MQSINVVVLNPWFLTLFLGMAVAGLAMVITALVRWPDPRSPFWLTGGLLHLAGTLLVTILCNVPRNNALAVVDPLGPEAAGLWAANVSTWTAWNHVRTAAALAAAASFTAALRLR